MGEVTFVVEETFGVITAGREQMGGIVVVVVAADYPVHESLRV